MIEDRPVSERMLPIGHSRQLACVTVWRDVLRVEKDSGKFQTVTCNQPSCEDFEILLDCARNNGIHDLFADATRCDRVVIQANRREAEIEGRSAVLEKLTKTPEALR